MVKLENSNVLNQLSAELQAGQREYPKNVSL